jgi:hypothetical protein
MHGCFNEKVGTYGDQKRWDKLRAKSGACSSFSLTSRGIVYTEFILAGQRVNFAYWCDVLQQLH